MLNFKKIFVWHMSNSRWEKAMDKVYDISKSFMAAHQRILDKRSKGKHPPSGRSRRKRYTEDN